MTGPQEADSTRDRDGPFGGRFFAWTPHSEPGVVLPFSPGVRQELGDFYAPTRRGSAALSRVFEVAELNGAATVVVEMRYIDADFRSAHEEFYAGKFRRYPSVCHRLHFFSSEFTNLTEIGAHRDGYLGYSVIRPLENGPVGRTMLTPPPECKAAMMCLVEDEAHLFGWGLRVRGTPFIGQDQQLVRCAHAVQWMVLYHAYLDGEAPRTLTADISEASGRAAPAARTLPSHGLSAQQLLVGLETLGRSPRKVELPTASSPASKDRREKSLFATICRHINSRIPPIVCSPNHAWLVVGYEAPDKGEHDDIVVFRHDGIYGPYRRVDDPWEEPDQFLHRFWSYAIAAYPPKAHLEAEVAETVGRWFLQQEAEAASDNAYPELASAIRDDRVHYRTYCARSSDYKRMLRGERAGVDPGLRDLYCFTQWPRFVWIVEAIDQQRRGVSGSEGQCVLGEVVLDSTENRLAHADDLRPLALHASGQASAHEPDHAHDRHLAMAGFTPYESGCPADSSTE